RTTSPPSRSIDTRSPRSAAPVSTAAASCTLSTSETLGKPRLPEWMGAVGPGHLAAQARCREHLPGVAQTGRIERAPHALHRLQVVGAEEEGHRAGLVDADTVLAGQRAAYVDARFQDRLRQRPRALRLALGARVVEHQRMQV